MVYARRPSLDYPGEEAALLLVGLTLAAKQAASTARTNQLSTGAAMRCELLGGRRAGYLLLKLTRPTGTIQNLICHPTDEKLDPRNREVAVGGGR